MSREGLRGPRGALWSPSTIHGNPKRGLGILRNELYIGRMVWNRQRFLKDPDTGKRVARPNPPSEWITKDVPELRILDDELWQAVPPPLLHPSMADIDRSKVEELAAALRREDTRLEASEMLRGLIESIVLTPEPPSRGGEGETLPRKSGQLRIELEGIWPRC
ncbi:hypothetical protein BH23ACI1_BH23ACI1_24020 [soil metagenome]